ncbi:MAG TPA: beta-N-acetylhexosaminidase [Polyangiaceae bacterium]|nr:beta-N-acetylhexosaminidase [Polyangiaceae bacterium]
MDDDLDLVRLCGQLLVCGFDGHDLPAPLAAALERGERGGVILFSRNVADSEQVTRLCKRVAERCPAELPPFIAVDQEGGRVARLGAPVVQLPPMRVLGATADPELCRRAGAILGTQLRALGFNLDFAPVLDVDTNPKNPVIGDRAFGSDPDVVARLGTAFADGLQGAGVLACGKHFPGHGDTAQDSHFDLPFVAHDKPRLDAVELPPFRAASLRKVASLMTAHVVYTALDPGIPATLSHKIATRLLRGELGFEGVLFSDDLEMRALSDRFDIERSAVAAVGAGCDALLVCKSSELLERAHAALVREAERDEAFAQRCRAAVRRSLLARRRCRPGPSDAPERAARFDDPRARELLAELDRRGASRA